MKHFILENGDSVVIREAKVSDANKILEYVNTISSESDFLTFGQGEFIKSVEQEEKHLDNTLRQNNAIYIIAEIDKKVVGSLNFSAGSRPRIVHTGEFGVSVLKEYWGNRIGTELIKYLIEWSKQSGVIRKINLIVRDDNFSAIHVYKKLGFTQEGIISRNLQINDRFYDALYMGYKID
ncbi:GNAT family N-acetyltransferase [Clostridium estertheticum]|uniref:GNAT family N-acetyltransferase n=1 Tax=Clostridium estertheticum TaxID=238834 RepID=UPI0013E97805|nr:GNAT family N-acetyltransferase [Clostridium estertheticum]MBZ9687394.1 GNAT family N-acetyltransferase [Clostridium estertheticum]